MPRVFIDNPILAIGLHVLLFALTAIHAVWFGFSKLLWLPAFLSFFACLPAFFWYFSDFFPPRLSWLLMLANLALNLGTFAAIHMAHGISYDCSESMVYRACTTNAWQDGLYFSIVTFTTLGYGDMQPTGYGRFFAALQALSGYLVLGVTVGAVLHWAEGRSNRS